MTYQKGNKHSPEVEQRRIESIRKTLQNPEVREKYRQVQLKKYRLAKLTGKKFGGWHHTTEAKRKIGQANKGKNMVRFILRKNGDKHPMLGKKHTEESKKKISIASIASGMGFKKGHKFSDESLKKMRISHLGKNIPLIQRQKMSYSHKKRFQNNPEDHPIYVMRKWGFISKPQKLLYESICRIFPKEIVVMEHPVITSKTARFIDIAVPLFQLGFECDGEYWHQDSEKDRLRDLELQEQGWEINHIPSKIIMEASKLGRSV